MSNHLDTIVWDSLNGSLKPYTMGNSAVRRFAPGLSPIVGFANRTNPDLDLLATICAPGELFYSDGWSGPLDSRWTLDDEDTMYKMVWNDTAPRPIFDRSGIVQLSNKHAKQALALAEQMHSGPFGARTLELGDYFGIFDGSTLVAMSGERFYANGLREISGVCTHPDHQGKGLARKLVSVLIHRQLNRGETPCLHVMTNNDIAHNLYKKLGFTDQNKSTVRQFTRVE